MSYRFAVLGLMTFLVSGPVFLSKATANAKPLTTQNKLKATPVQNATLDFELVNKTGYSLSGLYLSPTKTDEWGDNILEETVDDGDAVDISFSPDADAVKWDLRADWLMEDDAEEQEYVYWTGLSLDEITKLTLYYNKSTNKTSAKAE